MSGIFDGLLAEIINVQVSRALGRVADVARGTVQVTGLQASACLGDRVLIGGTLGGEVLRIGAHGVQVLPDGPADGLALGAEVALVGAPGLAPDDAWIGRIIDPYGRPMDDRPLFRGPVLRSLMADAPPASQRRRLGARMSTGVAVFDTLLPIVQGQRIGLFAGSGVGK